MKRSLITLVIASASTIAFAGSLKTLETEEQKVSYSQGFLLGKRMGMDFPDLDKDTFIQGFNHGFAGKEQLLTDEQVGEILMSYQRTLKQKQLEKIQELSGKNKEAGEAFLAANKNKEGVVTLASGLQYKVIDEGKGIQPGPTDTVKVHYTGSLINGDVFDSSIERGQPVSFPVNGVIKGWTEALQLMPQGSKWQLFIPSDLAYGSNGNRSIGPNETLLFDVELLEVIQN